MNKQRQSHESRSERADNFAEIHQKQQKVVRIIECVRSFPNGGGDRRECEDRRDHGKWKCCCRWPVSKSGRWWPWRGRDHSRVEFPSHSRTIEGNGVTMPLANPVMVPSHSAIHYSRLAIHPILRRKGAIIWIKPWKKHWGTTLTWPIGPLEWPMVSRGRADGQAFLHSFVLAASAFAWPFRFGGRFHICFCYLENGLLGVSRPDFGGTIRIGHFPYACRNISKAAKISWPLICHCLQIFKIKKYQKSNI